MEFVSVWVFLGGLGLGALIVGLFGRFRRRSFAAEASHPAIESARKILERQNYRVVEESKREWLTLTIWGKRMTVEVIADFVVEKTGKKSVVVVDPISGEGIASLSDVSRRKILEAQYAFPKMPVLLVRPSTEELTEVAFHARPHDLSSPSTWIGILALLVLALLIFLLLILR